MSGKGELIRNLVMSTASLLPRGLRRRLPDELLRIRHRLMESERQQQARRNPSVEPPRFSITGERLTRSILEREPPWADVTPPVVHVPGMLTEAERRYYTFLASLFAGFGEVVELGPWLGLSTRLLVESLKRNPSFQGRRVHVFDDFVWRGSWMSRWLRGTGIPEPEEHASFQAVFEAQMSGLEEYVHIVRSKFADFDGNESLPLARWGDGPIEIIVVDCGRSLAVNEGWWRTFAPSFVPNRTLVVMQDWQHFKAVPEVWWENTKIFTDAHKASLDLVHELRDSALATFLYRG